ncbi:tRNA-dihydrouridine synthase 3 [Strigomonas culicis]|uniref:tRNA-dihydrouridine(47) synthase [NAD(P)(+)] n=1 Tax=Strigomonas culicis TaxID=28005 RepID=S9VNW1_9TRYP|nr:tRNA-dihydrouridine synthase 3 [Strigomonas culicis]|eukprot:EPY24985.1 tRNA-dihydrouridine synthase 3 [Strigomonas culicis]
MSAQDEAPAASAVAAPAPAPVAESEEEKGVCPVKAAYRRPAPPKVSLNTDGRERGMNKGADRERSGYTEGTQRPTLEGETNFFHGEVLQRIKATVRQARADLRGDDGKRPRDEPPAPAADETTKDAEARETQRPTATEERLREHLAAQRDKAKRLFTDKLILAPLTTVGNLPFRRVCKSLGADVTVSEMAVAYNLNRMQKNEWSLLRRHESEDLFGIQLAVARREEAAQCAQALAASGFSYDFLDINCGCPVEKLVKMGCGCGLWERRGRLQEVVGALARHQAAPVSIKCRIGPDAEHPSLHRVIGEYEQWGAAAVTVHGRSRKQRYTRSANWDYVAQCADLTSLPVIGNGDVFGWEDVAAHRAARPGITSFMVGRGALIKPWIFEEIKSGQTRDMSSTERLEILKDFCRHGLAHWGADERGVMTTRRFLCEWLSFLHRYVPVGLLERLPQRMNDRPPYYEGRDDLETLMASDSVADWLRLSEMLLGPVEEKFRFTPKHKSNCYASTTGEEAPVEG